MRHGSARTVDAPVDKQRQVVLGCGGDDVDLCEYTTRSCITLYSQGATQQAARALHPCLAGAAVLEDERLPQARLLIPGLLDGLKPADPKTAAHP